MSTVLIQSNICRDKRLFVKRFLDVAAGLLALLFLSPVIFAISVLVKADSPGNIFFLQQRVGKNGKLFTIIKFRTLFVEHFGLFTEQEEPHAYRITRIGKYLRRFKLDEIPQFVNVVLGSMSIVGPRPDVPINVEKYVPQQHDRLLVKPGMTGITQVSGNTMLSWPERIMLDIWYVKNRTLMMDIKIIGYTLVAILRGELRFADPFHVYSLLPDRKQ